MSLPPSKNWSSTERNNISIQLSKLIEKGVIRKCSPAQGQFISSIFTVPKPDGSCRLIVNLKNLNKFIRVDHFKLEDIKLVSHLLTDGCFMATLDLTDAFYMIHICDEDTKFLRFYFLDDLYEFTCLPFGLCTAPYIFTKIMKPVLLFFRLYFKINLVLYLDDFLILGLSYEECLRNLKIIKYFLENLGFIVNIEKSHMTPSKEQQYLGLRFNSSLMRITLPDDKKVLIFNQVKHFQRVKKCKIRDFAEFIGRLVFACHGLKYSLIYTKRFERAKFLALESSNGNYDADMVLNSELGSDFSWWKSHILNSFNPIRQTEFVLELFTDASQKAWGAYCVDGKTHGLWSAQEKSLHINVLELKAVYYGLLCFAKNLKNCDILLRVDNTTAISYINRMGGIQFPYLNQIARDIWAWCESRNLWIYASYIRSKDNIEADLESRTVEPETEYELSHNAFNIILSKLGIPEIDLFASRVNCKCVKYVSWFRDPFAYEIDAFTVKWTKYFFYAFPPFSIIPKVLSKIRKDQATGIVVVPYWPTQAWYPNFEKMLISDLVFFGPKDDLLISYDRQQHPLCKNLILAAGKLSGRPSE